VNIVKIHEFTFVSEPKIHLQSLNRDGLMT